MEESEKKPEEVLSTVSAIFTARPDLLGQDFNEAMKRIAKLQRQLMTDLMASEYLREISKDFLWTANQSELKQEILKIIKNAPSKLDTGW